MIKLKNINKSYDNKSIVKNLNLNLKKGKLTSLIGANGAGKSTILSIASRLVKADSGEIYIEDKPLNSYKDNELAQKISILKQQNNINLRLKIYDLVAFGRFPYSQGKLTQKDHEIIEKALKYMNLYELKDRFLNTLSGGQKQRAFIAMIIAQDTDFIFLDEPLNNLDMKHCVHIMQLLKDLVKNHNKSIALVLHDINFASVYSDEIIALKDGELIHQGSAQDIIQSNILSQVYDMQIPIQEVNDKRICVYF